MQEDITAAKKGEAPAGFRIEKESEKDTIPPPVVAPGPKITPPPKPTAEVKLGELEKAKPLPGMKPFGIPPIPSVVPPASPKVAPGLTVPITGGINKKRLILLISGLVVITFALWSFTLRGPSTPVATVTPARTAAPTATPIPIENNFLIVDSVSISLGANFTERFGNSVNKTALTESAGEPGLYTVLNPTTGQSYTLSEFLGGLLIQAPAGFIPAAYESPLFLTVIYKSDQKNGYGFLVKIKDSVAAATAFNNWEQAMAQDLKGLLLFDPAKAASVTFLDNIYQGTAIRYRNFPDPNLTIDHAIVTARNGEKYLVVTNSREHIYSIIDKLK
jgi:hypothetical protein